MKPDYIILRLIRHFLPEKIVRFLLLQRIIIRPGLETSSPNEAVQRYIGTFKEHGFSMDGKQIMIIGYGGRFAVACGLLEAGASRIILTDPFAPPNHAANLHLMPKYTQYLMSDGKNVYPRDKYMQLVQDDITKPFVQSGVAKADFIISNSVLEHVDQMDKTVAALSALTRADGTNFHFVDLRDHYFKYPFEMLTYPRPIWRKWLNPSSNLNRLRVKDYREIFGKYFESVDVNIQERNMSAFSKTKKRILPEFLSGDDNEDSVTGILLKLSHPILAANDK